MKKIIITPNGTQEVDLTAEEIEQAQANNANAQATLQAEVTS
jgi:hypothetical protein